MAATLSAELENTLGFNFSDQALLSQALTHSSCVHENPQLGPDNEPLEFLGDAVLGLAVGTLLLEACPEHRPGQLSKLRAAMVNEQALARLAKRLGLGAALRLGRGEEATGGRTKPSILAGAYEALLGAVYLEGGFAAALEIVRRHFSPPAQPAADHKTALQELCQARYRMLPDYRVEEVSGPPHRRTFQVSTWLGERRLATGQGRSKKAAEVSAAEAALTLLEAEEDEP